jgi:hypothetical protein
MANPNKAAGYKRKMARLEEESRNTRGEAEQLQAEFQQKYAGRNVVIKITSFRVGPRPFSRPNVTKQAYNYTVRVYEKDTQ